MSDLFSDHGPASARPWSVSESHAMAECPRQWWFRYVAKAIPAQPRSPKQIIGAAIHAGLEAAYRAAREAINATPSSRAFRSVRGVPLVATGSLAALAAFSAYWDTHGLLIREYERDDAERLLLELLETLATPQPWEILAVEEKFTFRVEPRDSTPAAIITGVMDLVFNTSVGTSKSIHIRDWKLGSVPTNPEELERNVQLCTYAAAATWLWPWVTRITVGLYSIRERREVRTTLHPDSIEHTARELLFDAETGRLRAERKWVEPTPGEHCGSCRFRSYCPAMNKMKSPVLATVDIKSERARLAQLLH